MELGEVLGHLGDPRLATPAESAYWVKLRVDDHALLVGRFLVTTKEFVAWLDQGGLVDDSVWSEDGKRWRDTRRTLWTDLAAAPDAAHLVVPNQPAIGVTWYEAEAYANTHDARLLSLDERMQIMRGDVNRPYPWGQPFGQRNANTREEAMGKPSAVGLFQRDQTPEGVCDLAGNVAEWTSDEADEERVIHPGSWNAPSMSAWAKARALVPPKTRSADLGFRIARES
jgi:formylglycine-generating enzyme required for sulfatase activity